MVSKELTHYLCTAGYWMCVMLKRSPLSLDLCRILC